MSTLLCHALSLLVTADVGTAAGCMCLSHVQALDWGLFGGLWGLRSVLASKEENPGHRVAFTSADAYVREDRPGRSRLAFRFCCVSSDAGGG